MPEQGYGCARCRLGQGHHCAAIGDHVDATVFDADRKLIFNSNGEGTVTVIREESPDTYSVVQTVRTAPRAKTMALDPKTHQLFLSTAENGQFEVLVVRP